MSEEHLKHLHDNRWEVTRYIHGKGLEISTNDFLCWHHAIKLVSEDNPVRYAGMYRFVTVDFKTLPEVSEDSLQYIFVTENEPGTIISDESKAEWLTKLNDNGHLILHHDFKFEVFDKQGVQVFLPEKQDKHVCVVRYGAFGDIMQTSSVFAELKRQKYYITFIGSPPGTDVITHDPNIDELILQEKDVVRNIELGLYWKWLAKRYDKFINLSESVEGTLLPDANRMAFHWPADVRKKYMNRNYVQFMHEVSQIPYELRVKFFPNEDEVKWAKGELAEMSKRSGCTKTIVWSLAGSSVHKVYPWLDNIIKKVMTDLPDTQVVLVGGPECFQLQGGWQDEPRVHLRVGTFSIRQSLVFTQQCSDLVIGPETGVMNAVCVEPMPKIVFLSHSTKENLTRDWNNTASMMADEKQTKKGCDNCCKHRLHTSWEYCQRGPVFGAALCQELIEWEEVFNVVQRALRTGKVKGQA